MQKNKKTRERLYYILATATYGWSRAGLLNQIKAKAYERSLIEEKSNNFADTLPEYLAEQADEAMKSSYNLEFLGIKKLVHERELENRLIDRLKDFILELGYGFCFIGSQYRIVLKNKEYFIDLLFYHRFLKSLVAIELKVTEFKPEYAGKMDFYLNLLNEKEQAEGDNPAIGIILCAEQDNLEVEFSLMSKSNPIGVAEYQLFKTLPEELKGQLPSIEEIAKITEEAKQKINI
jgi:predicted nuclease of restriction endonuclease-like (RecB) superfamily